jgi:hypothetical protein
MDNICVFYINHIEEFDELSSMDLLILLNDLLYTAQVYAYSMSNNAILEFVLTDSYGIELEKLLLVVSCLKQQLLQADLRTSSLFVLKYTRNKLIVSSTYFS